MKIQLTKENLNIFKTLFRPKTGLPVHIHGYELKENHILGLWKSPFDKKLYVDISIVCGNATSGQISSFAKKLLYNMSER